METLEFTIGIEPVTKKNHQRIATRRDGRRFVVPSQAYTNYECAAGYFIKGKGMNISEPVTVKALYYMGTRKKVDIANLNSCLHDVLVKYNVLEDDNVKIIVSTDGTRVRYDKENPRTEVTISPASEEDCVEAAKFEVKKKTKGS